MVLTISWLHLIKQNIAAVSAVVAFGFAPDNIWGQDDYLKTQV